MRKILLLLSLWGACLSACLADTLPLAALDKALPRADSPFWRDSIPAEMRQSYVQYGAQYLGKPWEVLPITVFSEFKTNGNRVNYERLNFEKRRQFAALVMAEIMEGEGHFMGDIINGFGSFCEETWWGIPAHYGTKIPLPEDQTVDLFNAETASLVVWAAYMLRPQLDKFAPQLYQRIEREMKRRILEPALATDYWWKKAGMNWNPWICSNWLACVLICEDNPQQKEAAIRQIIAASNAFIDSYPEDGGCDEGPGYWDRAAASLFEVLYLLEAAETSKAVADDLASLMEKLPKIRAMASYVYKTYIGNDYCVNFADTHDNRTLQQVNIVYPFGLWLGDKTMREFAAYLGKQKNILANPAPLYDKSGNFPTLGRELFFLRHINDFMCEQPREPLLKDVWLGNLQIMTARRGNLFVAMKGGTNGESHNHNDVGSFIVYADNMPLLIDVGVGEYTSKTFSSGRYEIWSMQSGYHNLPQINSVDEKDGKEYHSTVVSHKNGQLCLDIAAAYPEDAAVKSWKRTVSAGNTAITVTEDYELEAYKQPSKLMFISTVKPVIDAQRGMLNFETPSGNRKLKYDARQVEPSVEDISDLLDPLLRGIWGEQMYRIVLTIKSEKTKEQIKYTIL